MPVAWFSEKVIVMYQSAKEWAVKAKNRVVDTIDNATGKIVATATGVATLGSSLVANAAAPDFSTLTAAVDFSTVITAILLVMAGLAGVYIVWVGGGMILTKLKAGK